MDKDNEDTKSNNGQDETPGQQNEVDNPDDDACYIHMCRTSAQLLHILSQIDICTSTPVQVLELESMSDDSESRPSSAPSSMTSSTPTSMSDEGSYVIWAEPIMTCKIIPTRTDGMADVRRLPPGARNAGTSAHTTSTSCTTSNSSSTVPGSSYKKNECNVSKRNSNTASSATQQALFSEALRKMASAADTIRQARNVLSSLPGNQQANNNNIPESNAADENENKAEPTREGQTSTLPRTQKKSERGDDNPEPGEKFPEPILVRSYTETEKSIPGISVSEETKNLSMGDSRSTQVTYTSLTQQPSPRHGHNNRLRPNALVSRTSWSSNMFDSDYQATRVARYPRIYGPGYRRTVDPNTREDGRRVLHPVQESHSHRSSVDSTLSKSAFNIGIGSTSRSSGVVNDCPSEGRKLLTTQSCSSKIRNKITLVDFRSALNLAIRNLEKNDVWMSYKNNLHTGAKGLAKISSNSFDLSQLGELNVSLPCRPYQGNRARSPREKSTCQTVNSENQNQKPPADGSDFTRQRFENNVNALLLSRARTLFGKVPTSDLSQQSTVLRRDKRDRNSPDSEIIPQSPLNVSKQRKNVEFLIPKEVELKYSPQLTDRSASRGSNTKSAVSPPANDEFASDKDMGHKECRGEISFYGKYDMYFKPIETRLEKDCDNNCGDAGDVEETWKKDDNRTEEDAESSSSRTFIVTKAEHNVSERTENEGYSVYSRQSLGSDSGIAAGVGDILIETRHVIDESKPPFIDVFHCDGQQFVRDASHISAHPDRKQDILSAGEVDAFGNGDNVFKYNPVQGRGLVDTMTASPTRQELPQPFDVVVNRVIREDLFGDCPVVSLGDIAGYESPGDKLVTCDKIMTEINENRVINDNKLISKPNDETILSDDVKGKGDFQHKQADIVDDFKVKAVKSDAELHGSDEEDDESVTMRSVSVSISLASVASKCRLQPRFQRIFRTHFLDKHVSEFFNHSEIELLDEPLVIESLRRCSPSITDTDAGSELADTSHTQTVGQDDQAVDQTDQKPDPKIFVTDSGTRLKSILAAGQPKTPTTESPTRFIARDLELVSIASEDLPVEEEVKKVKWEMLSELSFVNTAEPVHPASDQTSVKSLHIEEREDQTQESVKESKKKRDPFKVRIQRFFKSCLKLNK
ncbi:hypothetical protein Btru_065946 [Bulinus truncatus]|nr:hypothetical protein Btru_065946 [Bulinus truncatus]